MRNYVKLILCAVLLFLLAGCTSQSKPDPSGIKIYYTNSGKTKLVEETVAAEAKEQKQLIEELLGILKKEPKNPECSSTMPKDVQITGYSVQGQRLILDFSESYKNMDKVTEVLMRAAIVKTLLQVEGLKDVVFWVNTVPLLDELGEEVGVMNTDTFIDTKGQGINSYQYASLTLYFPTAEGDMIAKEMRNVHYSTNTTIERVVLEQLIAGPANPNLRPLFPADTKVNSVTISNSICTVNFDESVQNASSDKSISTKAVLYSIVNSLTDVCGVSEVQFQIGGKSSDVTYRSISLKDPFVRNQDIIYQIEGAEPVKQVQETETAILDNSDGNQTEAKAADDDGAGISSEKGQQNLKPDSQNEDTPQSDTKQEPDSLEHETNVREPAIGIDPNLQTERKGDGGN